MKPTLLILAAGMGSRYGSLKQVDQLGPSGETIMDYSVYDAMRAGFGKVVFVIRKSLENDFKEIFNRYKGKIEVDYVFQEIDNVPAGISIPADRVKPWGTGHAILVARKAINTPFAVINADDFYDADAFKVMAEHLSKPGLEDIDKYAMVGYPIQNTLSEFGHVSRGVCELNANQCLTSVIERLKIQRMNNEIVYFDENDKPVALNGDEMVSMNFWGFPVSIFDKLEKKFNEFIVANSSQLKSEFYIPMVVNELVQEKTAHAKVLKTTAQWFGITYKEDKPIAIENFKKLTEKGLYPQKLW